MTRRNFIGGAAALGSALGFPALVRGQNLNSRLAHACIGTGGKGEGDWKNFITHPKVDIVAGCDVDTARMANLKNAVPGLRAYQDWRELFEKEGDKIDSVNVSTPDHTHAQYIIEALKRGLNVYAQKPLCHDIGDCRSIAKLTAEKKAVTQLGTQIAAWECDRQTAAALRSGTIGEVRRVWLFSTRRGQPAPSYYLWPNPELPVPKTLEWKLWLGPAKWRPYGDGYHPRAWRKWREFGTSWLGDLGLHLMSPVWLGLNLGATRPTSVVAEISADDWTPAQREQFWPSMSHVTWTMPGMKASGGKPFTVEWCDGFGNVEWKLPPKFFPPAFLQDIAALTPMKRLPSQGRVVEGTRGWLLSTHYGVPPCYVMKDGSNPPDLPYVGPATSHYHEYIDRCLGGAKTRSGFEMAAPLTEWGFMGNLAQLKPGERLDCAKM